MTASNYPHAIDLDTQLLRRVATDAIVPADHNNLVDAIEAVQATLGTANDGTQGGGSQAFTTSLLDLLSFPGTAMGNPRYPFVPLPAGAWYGRAGATPGTWTLGPGTSVAYDRPRGLARLAWADASPYLVASTPVVGSAPWCLIFRVRTAQAVDLTGRDIQIGFSVDGSGTDIDGVGILNSGAGFQDLGRLSAGAYIEGEESAPLPVPHGLVRIDHDGTDVNVYLSADGAVWNRYGAPFAAAGTPTVIAIACMADGDENEDLILDYIVQGNGAAPNA